MTRPIDTVADTVEVDHSQFLLASWMGGYADPPGWPSWDETARLADADNWFAATANRGIVISDVGFHKVKAALELWDAEPPGDGEGWHRSRTVLFYSSSGFACVDEVGGRVTYAFLDLRMEHRQWWVRASSRPGDNPLCPVDALPEGLEVWRFRFWPVVAPDRSLGRMPRRQGP
ncbi:hypothetical protein [Nonomuraea rhodomycinica]|uniref:Uncharacterized protein n=1 Tax=Nonomuraea rhodomycinica TaxID=1712872 RepID=A0A7Y6IVZ4_9ACTN|nr:hypothetical protein [Nonomuraea rhodomycinica]NUW45416.1 hypothetical protein [Nonomuraea rhodomycinica]